MEAGTGAGQGAGPPGECGAWPRNLKNPKGAWSAMRVLVTLALLASLLSGCTVLGSDGPTVATAADWQPVADRAARAWAEDATLVGISGGELDDRARAEFGDELADAREEYEEERAEAKAEGDEEDMEEFDEAAEQVDLFFDLAQVVVDTPDDKVGDGRATVWMYSYVAESAGAEYFVAVAHGDAVLKKSSEDMGGFDDFGSHDAEPLGDWSIDSDEAADAAALGDPDYARLCGETNVASSVNLVAGEDGPVWSVGIEAYEFEGDEPDEAYLAIDANDGSILKDEAVVVEDAVDVVLQELGRDDGTFLASVATSSESIFDVLDGRHLELAVEASISPAPAQPVTATITDPMGTQTVLTLGLEANPGRATQSVVLSVVPNGTYSVQFDVPLSVFSSWRMSWCTDGTPEDYDDSFEVPACLLLSQSGGDGGETLSPAPRWARAWLR